MNMEHHTLTVHAAADVVHFWKRSNARPRWRALDAVYGELKNWAQVDQMGTWAAGADLLKDLVVSEGLASFIIKRVSAATSFQHFAYCAGGAHSDDVATKDDPLLPPGKTATVLYGGYCWDRDPHLTWYEELANLSTADVRFNPHTRFNAAFWDRSPSAAMITGDEDWDDQVYPSAIDMAVFFGGKAAELRPNKAGWSLESLCYGIHMVQDLTVPQHVLCTIEQGHAAYEEAMLRFWKWEYSTRSRDKKDAVLETRLADAVESNLEALANTDWRTLGNAVVDQTGDRLRRAGRIPEANKFEALDMTARAVAATLRAIEIYVR